MKDIWLHWYLNNLFSRTNCICFMHTNFKMASSSSKMKRCNSNVVWRIFQRLLEDQLNLIFDTMNLKSVLGKFSFNETVYWTFDFFLEFWRNPKEAKVNESGIDNSGSSYFQKRDRNLYFDPDVIPVGALKMQEDFIPKETSTEFRVESVARCIRFFNPFTKLTQ